MASFVARVERTCTLQLPAATLQVLAAGFFLTATLCGLLAERRADRSVLRSLPAILAGEVAIYAAGLTWLAPVRAPRAGCHDQRGSHALHRRGRDQGRDRRRAASRGLAPGRPPRDRGQGAQLGSTPALTPTRNPGKPQKRQPAEQARRRNHEITSRVTRTLEMIS